MAAAVAAATFAGTPAEAAGDGGVLSLEWSAPAECPTRDEVVRDVERLLGPVEGPNKPRTIKAQARITHGTDGRWRVRIQTMGPGAGERRLDAASCDALAKATALVLALRINPNLPLPEPEPPPTPPPPPAPPAPPPEPPPLPPTPSPTPSPTPAPERPPATPEPLAHTGAVSVGPALLSTLGELPSPSESAGLVVGLGPALLHGARVEAHGEISLGQQHPTAGSSLGGGSVWAAGGGLRGCYGPTFGGWTILGCAGGEGDMMHVTGSGSRAGSSASTSLAQSAAWVTIEAAAELRWAVSRWFALHLDAAALAPIDRPKFVVQDSTGRTLGIVAQPAAVWGRLGIGAEVTFF